jgi:hypothetical protein
MVAQPTYIKIIQGPHTGKTGIHVGKEGDFHKIRLDEGYEIFVKDTEFLQKKLPKFVMIVDGVYKGYTGFFTGMRAGKLAIRLDATNSEITVFRHQVRPLYANQRSYYSKMSVSPTRDDLLVSAGKSRSRSQEQLLGYQQQVEGNVELPESPFTVLFTELKELLFLDMTYLDTVAHIRELDRFYSAYTSLLTTKESKKLACIAYIFVLLNNNGQNLLYNPVIPVENIRPNDDPSYILFVASKLGYLKSGINTELFNTLLQNILFFFNKQIIQNRVYNRYKTPENKPPRVNKPIRASLSRMRLVMKNTKNSKGQSVPRLLQFNSKQKKEAIKKDVVDIVRGKLKSAKSIERKYLEEYINNINNIEYLKKLHTGSNKQRQDYVLKYQNLIKDRLKLEKDKFYNQNVRKEVKFVDQSNVLSEISKIEKERLKKGLEIFKKDSDSIYVLNYLIKNFDNIIKQNAYKNRELRIQMKLQEGKERLLSEAIIALNEKVVLLVNANKEFKKSLKARNKTSIIPMFMNL